MTELPYLNVNTPFPPRYMALEEPDGLLAYGADLSPRRLLNAYTNGIFPWFSEGEPILWWSPSTRAIIPLDHFHISTSLHKLIKQNRYRVSLNEDFKSVIEQCAKIPRIQDGEVSNATWICEQMIFAYHHLHEIGLCHSVEVWSADTLVGGLYGVAVGNVFCGESMFHLAPNTSKLAMAYLVSHMKEHNLAFIDCQLPTKHLSSLGAIEIPRENFMEQLQNNNQTLDEQNNICANYRSIWQAKQLSGQ